jgi:predicted phosphodiesterase
MERKCLMKDISVMLPQEVTEIKILLLGDVHRGSQQFNEKEFLETVEFIRKNDNYYAILMGDLIDNATRNSKSNCYLAVESPQASVEWVINKLKPIADRILAVTTGNHEERSEKEVGMDISWWIAKCLGIEERYSQGPFILFVSMGKNQNRTGMYHTFSLYGIHGDGMGTTLQGAVRKLQLMGDVVVNADVYIIGHSHKPLIMPSPRIVIDTKNKKHNIIDPLFVNGQSFLNFEGSYGEKKGYLPTSQRKPIIKLKTGYDKKYVSLEIS